MDTKYIFVTGGVMSGVGKGVATSSIAALLQARGFNVTSVKIDPYINVDAGTMNPVEHGEVFVTDDGVECDQDIGNYERFLNRDLSAINYMTTGRVYQTVIEKERNLEYDGKSVEVVPHIPEEVIRRIRRAAKEVKDSNGNNKTADFVLVEIGGTTGEYQNLLFLEAARMMHLRSPKDVLFALVSYLPMPSMIGEMKTKPTQHAVRTLNSSGIQPDIIIARSELPIDVPRKKKIATFCNMDEQHIISAPDIRTSIYEIPLNFEEENVGKTILNTFGMRDRKADLRPWKRVVSRIHKSLDENGSQPNISIGIVGKYFETGKFVLSDSYISVIEAIKHASWQEGVTPSIYWLSAGNYEKNTENLKDLDDYDGIIVPGGFGTRAIEGKIKAIQYARENNIPYFGLCYGMQLAAVEFARNVCGIKDAITTEAELNAREPVIDVMPEQKSNLREKNFGATMRLGSYNCTLKNATISKRAYRSKDIRERHRHRYELNDAYREALEDNGLIIAGNNPESNLAEIIELPQSEHKFFVGTQFHPELKSRPFAPHPLFREFIKATSS